MEQQTTPGSGYGKRPLWQWILIYVILAVIVYGLVYYFVIAKNNGYTSTSSQTYPPITQYAPQPTSPVQSQSSNPTQPQTNSQNVVTYSDSGFSPSTVTIKKGDTVIFKNSASDGMRVASNPHPIHNGYPTKGGCVSSTFDSCNNIPPGKSWSFMFTIVGTWKFRSNTLLSSLC